jgi:redox-sensitive bicupin YhaK (pirin superfamily)
MNAQENLMLTLRKAQDRGHADHGWLNSHHSFSFADYHDPAHMGFGNLRVLNDDTVAAGGGFGTHGHRDMEIISYVLSGALAHKDSMGNGTAGGAHAGVIVPGDVQRMTAGTGVRHSEFNHSKDAATHFLQIWILPERGGIEPGYEQVNVPAERKRGQLALVAAPQTVPGAVTLNADARIFAGLFDGDERQELPLPSGRLTYVHLATGSLLVNGQRLEAGDALKVRGEDKLVLEGGKDAEVLVFDLKP